MNLVLKPTFKTELYLTEGGYIALKQEGYIDPNTENLVLLSPDQAWQIQKAIDRVLKTHGDALRNAMWEEDQPSSAL